MSATTEDRVKGVLRYFEGFPKPGIRFVDVNPILSTPPVFSELTDLLASKFSGSRTGATCVAALESRGYYFGIPLAQRLGLPFVPLRKPGKLPGEVMCVEYGKEYGKDQIQVQKGAIPAGSRVLLVDDLLATGGTLAAACQLVRQSGATVAQAICIIELVGLNGRSKLPADVPLYCVIQEP